MQVAYLTVMGRCMKSKLPGFRLSMLKDYMYYEPSLRSLWLYELYYIYSCCAL